MNATQVQHYALEVLMTCLVLSCAAVARGHVLLDAPAGGETVAAGSVLDITWHPLILHSTQNYDLWYSTTSSGGPWMELALDLPAFEVVGQPHHFAWTVPSIDTSTAFIRVEQDNPGMNYDSTSGAFAITAAGGLTGDYNGDGMVGLADYNVWRDSLGSTTDLAANGDDTGASQGVIDMADYQVWTQHFGETAPAAGTVTAVPEPGAVALAIIACMLAFTDWR